MTNAKAGRRKMMEKGPRRLPRNQDSQNQNRSELFQYKDRSTVPIESQRDSKPKAQRLTRRYRPLIPKGSATSPWLARSCLPWVNHPARRALDDDSAESSQSRCQVPTQNVIPFPPRRKTRAEIHLHSASFQSYPTKPGTSFLLLLNAIKFLLF
ncbi:MAG: hypothetical protein JWN25_3174 [Verrucomicrobiales bacterium]|nr:hypothetical protein [Verrucomicrobiales bacterium]